MENSEDLELGLAHFGSELELIFEEWTPPPKANVETFVEPINLNNYLTEHCGGRLVPLDEHTKKPLIVMFHHFGEKCAYLTRFINYYFEAARKFPPDELRFVVADFKDAEILKIKSRFLDSEFDFYLPPEIFAIDAQDRTYFFSNYFNAETLHSYGEKLLKGEVYISEPITPTPSNESTLVVAAVADNFQRLVLENEQDVMLTIYSPWCFFSIKLIVKLEELALLLKEEPISIVKINADANFIPIEYYPFSFPKTYYISKTKRNAPVEYNGGSRALQNLIKFVAENSTVELKAYDRLGQLK